MAHFVTFSIQILIAMAMVLICASAVAAQGGSIAPSPAMDTGAGFALPVYGTLIYSSLLFSLVALFLH
ncbi:RNA-binding protein like [Actinidia chinensis var. chinensis]|uniref:RNA-binding protein like n=1 Tax=Actinidia chinensis var. chinensis TaxID=1590841 RepID=A0A2R6R587_ACTCC|nr:RNA-binding protein like [Actinidia chinensis var. chinensis]